MLRFVVLSDIHFRAGVAGEVWDQDHDVRARLVEDLQSIRVRLGEFSGVLVNGDIAFAGAEAEYDYARKWFDEVCDAAGCARDQVWTVPGNHDVERSAVRNDPAIRALHRDLRDGPAHQIDAVIAEYLRSGRRTLLFDHIERYNDFAAAYGCNISPEQPVWQHSMGLDAVWTLRLVGLNSTLCSDSDDTSLNDRGKLVLGTLQATAAQPKPATVHLAMCHHPLRWLRDEAAVERVLCSRHTVHVFGHEHRQDPHVNRGSLWLHCGAVHPVREEAGWIPTYNIMELDVQGAAESPVLAVRLYTRIWSDNHRFRAEWTDDGKEARTELLPLPGITPAEVRRPADRFERSGVKRSLPVEPSPAPEHAPAMEPKRRLAYHFLTLPHHERVDISVRLGLVRDEDEGVRDRDLFGRFFQRASDEHRLAELWAEVEQRHPDGKPEPNPFTLE